MRAWPSLLSVCLLVACSRGGGDPARTGSGSAGGGAIAIVSDEQRTKCIAVRDHVVDLIGKYYVANAAETFDGLDRADPGVAQGLDPLLTRDTFGAFLGSEAGKAWLDRAKLRTVATNEMAETVDKCVKHAKPDNLACWLGSTNLPAFQLCPPPASSTGP